MAHDWRAPGVILLVGGCAAQVAVFAGFVSRAVWRPGGVVVPWGLALGLAASVGVVLVARAIGRGAGFVAAGGWVIGLALLLSGGPGGDYVIASDTLGWAFLVVATGAVLVTSGWGGSAR